MSDNLIELAERVPLVSAAQLSGLSEDEIVEGYRDGLEGWAEPGDNRSLSYWHGWRNGAVDGGHVPKDIYQATLAHSVVAERRVAALRARHACGSG